VPVGAVGPKPNFSQPDPLGCFAPCTGGPPGDFRLGAYHRSTFQSVAFQMADPALTLKITLIGEPGVGKTSIINRFINGTFDNNYSATIGFSYLSRRITHDSEEYTVDIWDTSGSERFRSMAPNYYRGSDGCILVYDVTQPGTAQALSFWYEEFSSIVNTGQGSNVAVLIVGNKADLLPDDSALSTAALLKETHDFSEHYLVSAQSGERIEEPFFRLVELCAKRHNEERTPMLLLRSRRAEEAEKGGCC
jgi:small GTP-binding protein